MIDASRQEFKRNKNNRIQGMVHIRDCLSIKEVRRKKKRGLAGSTKDIHGDVDTEDNTIKYGILAVIWETKAEHILARWRNTTEKPRAQDGKARELPVPKASISALSITRSLPVLETDCAIVTNH